MKRIIAIFSVIFIAVSAVPTVCIAGCPDSINNVSTDCNAWEDLCVGDYLWHADETDCKQDWRVAVVGTYKQNGDEKTASSIDIWRADTVRQNEWFGDGSFGQSWCSNPAVPGRSHIAHSILHARGADGTHYADGFGEGNSWGVRIQKNGCIEWKCAAGYTYNSTTSKCEDNNAAARRQNCTNTHGDWDSDTSTCTCDTTKGLTGPASDGKCSCAETGYRWSDDENQCVNPDQATIDECTNSGGDWLNGTCNCDALAPEKISNGQKCVENPAYTKCINSGGTYTNNACDCTTGLTDMKESGGECVCSDPGMMKVTNPTTGKITGCSRSRQAICESYGGTWQGSAPDDSNGACKCDTDPDKNLVDDTQTQGTITYKICKCKNSDYDWKNGQVPNPAGCSLTDDATRRRDTFEQLKGICETDWGSTWSPSTWEYDNPDGRDPTKWKCTCSGSGVVQGPNKTSCMCDTSNGYVLRPNSSPYVCEQLDCAQLQTLCNGVSDATYRDNGSIHGRQACSCRCNDSQKVFVKSGTTASCQSVGSVCNLINDTYMDRYGNCKCKYTNAAPVNGRCPNAAQGSGSSNSGGQNTNVDVTAKKQQIAQLTQDLKSISDGFGKSHWKTASGNFNGARLASDSIAGVVLGTVGGVVTSNIVKKNQLRGGFDNLQCTVGGQMVAEFGDQFQVGIR